jgi:hypothetical protein
METVQAPAETACMQLAQPQQEHHWLQKFVGEWTYESEMCMGPDAPPMRSTGTESVRSVGGLWIEAEGQIVCEGQGDSPGGHSATSIMTLGFDARTQRFVGTFICSMMHHLWVYDGALDGAERVLSLESDGPSMAGDGSLARYQDAIELVDDDHRVLHGSVRGDDGQWQEFMTAHYRRTK